MKESWGRGGGEGKQDYHSQVPPPTTEKKTFPGRRFLCQLIMTQDGQPVTDIEKYSRLTRTRLEEPEMVQLRPTCTIRK